MRLSLADRLRDAVDGDRGGPCDRVCRECSGCARFEAAWRNRRQYGQADYPGGPVPTW